MDRRNRLFLARERRMLTLPSIQKYCVYRPMLILHTTLFAPQTDDLNQTDIAAAWSVLNAMETPQMIIYNCGVESGSSQGHKHLQIFPRQDSKDFSMWPSQANHMNGTRPKHTAQT